MSGYGYVSSVIQKPEKEGKCFGAEVVECCVPPSGSTESQTQALCKISSGLNCLANWTVPKALLTNKHFSPFRCKHLDKICPYLPSAFLSLVHNNH